jgi:hypothetical protein
VRPSDRAAPLPGFVASDASAPPSITLHPAHPVATAQPCRTPLPHHQDVNNVHPSQSRAKLGWREALELHVNRVHDGHMQSSAPSQQGSALMNAALSCVPTASQEDDTATQSKGVHNHTIFEGPHCSAVRVHSEEAGTQPVSIHDSKPAGVVDSHEGISSAADGLTSQPSKKLSLKAMMKQARMLLSKPAPPDCSKVQATGSDAQSSFTSFPACPELSKLHAHAASPHTITGPTQAAVATCTPRLPALSTPRPPDYRPSILPKPHAHPSEELRMPPAPPTDWGSFIDVDTNHLPVGHSGIPAAWPPGPAGSSLWSAPTAELMQPDAGIAVRHHLHFHKPALLGSLNYLSASESLGPATCLKCPSVYNPAIQSNPKDRGIAQHLPAQHAANQVLARTLMDMTDPDKEDKAALVPMSKCSLSSCLVAKQGIPSGQQPNKKILNHEHLPQLGNPTHGTVPEQEAALQCVPQMCSAAQQKAQRAHAAAPLLLLHDRPCIQTAEQTSQHDVPTSLPLVPLPLPDTKKQDVGAPEWTCFRAEANLEPEVRAREQDPANLLTAGNVGKETAGTDEEAVAKAAHAKLTACKRACSPSEHKDPEELPTARRQRMNTHLQALFSLAQHKVPCQKAPLHSSTTGKASHASPVTVSAQLLPQCDHASPDVGKAKLSPVVEGRKAITTTGNIGAALTTNVPSCAGQGQVSEIPSRTSAAVCNARSGHGQHTGATCPEVAVDCNVESGGVTGNENGRPQHKGTTSPHTAGSMGYAKASAKSPLDCKATGKPTPSTEGHVALEKHAGLKCSAIANTSENHLPLQQPTVAKRKHTGPFNVRQGGNGNLRARLKLMARHSRESPVAASIVDIHTPVEPQSCMTLHSKHNDSLPGTSRVNTQLLSRVAGKQSKGQLDKVGTQGDGEHSPCMMGMRTLRRDTKVASLPSIGGAARPRRLFSIPRPARG